MKKRYRNSIKNYPANWFFAGLFMILSTLCTSAQNTSDETNATPPATGIRNPFSYSAPDNDQGLIPVDAGRLPAGIRLAAVLIINNDDILAALRLPGETAAVFVRVNDLISVNFQNEAPTKKDSLRSSTAISVAERAPVYLLIKSITATGVEVAPRIRPTEVHLIR